ncbi:MAG: ABC transporter substrate-binding protein, partial [Lachnospiraceae bacterium]
MSTGMVFADETTAEVPEIEMADASEVDGTTISFWHSMGGVNGQAIDTLVQKFNDENEYGITVEAEYQGSYDDALNKLKSAQIGNMGADLVQVYEIGTRFMIESGWIVPMQSMVNADEYDTSVLEPNLAAYYTINDMLYSMPFNSSTPLMYYNKDMFDAAGITEIPDSLESIAQIGDKLLDSGAQEVMSLGIYGWFFEQFIGKQGLEYANNGNGRTEAATAVAFDENGAAANILNEWKNLYDLGYAPNVGKGGDAGLADFSAGKSAITLGSTASLKQILQDVDGKFEVGTAYFPKVKSTDEGGVSIGGASLWALDNNDPKKLRATWEFVKFLISPESQAFWNAETGYFPVNVDAHDEDVFKENIEKYPQFETAIDQLHDSAPQYAG